MKALLIIFVIYISYTLGEENKVPEKAYPKKYRSYANGKILINYAKYDKYSTPTPMTYTAFQVVGSDQNTKMIRAGVPDSPYFPVDLNAYAQKPRPKKILPDFPWSLFRQKRSAVLEVTPSPAVKDEKKIETKVTEAVKVQETTLTTAASSKDVKEATTGIKSNEPQEVSKSTINTTNAKPTTDQNEVARVGKAPEKKVGPVRTVQSKPKTVAKKNSARVNGNKPKAKVAAGRAKVAAGRAKVAAGRAKPKARQAKRAKKPNRNQAARNKNKKRKGNPQRTKNQKARPKYSRAGKKPKETRRLIAAREALIEDYPYVVSIQKDEQHWCSGALLNQRMVITTANCLWKANHISRMTVRAGSRHSNQGGQLAGIQEVMKHPGWGLRKAPDNDVALLLLDKNLKFSDSVHGVDLPNRAMLPAFEDAWITSWGAERRDGVFDAHDTTTLQVYHAQLIDREKCNNATIRFNVIVTENFICLAQSGRQAPCTRDTGAPAVSDGILWGLASWGIRKLCGTERFPAVFSYLASHSNIDFILNATRFLMSDKRQYPFADRYPQSLMKRK